MKAIAPGKLMIAGEWSVLEISHPSICAAIDINVEVKTTPVKGAAFEISAPDVGVDRVRFQVSPQGEMVFEGEIKSDVKEKLKFVESVVVTMSRYRTLRPMGLSINSSGFTVSGRKLGFGSSAAVTVALTAALLGSTKDKLLIYKLAAIASYLAQGKVGSGFDIATSSFGGIIMYKRFDPAWLIAELSRSISIEKLVNKDWPHVEIEKISVPEDVYLLVGWTGESASTTKMINAMNRWRSSNDYEYTAVVMKIAEVVNALARAWENQDREGILQGLNQNRYLLRELTKLSSVEIETARLRLASDIAEYLGAAGKLSGAGGGDNAIAVTFSDEVRTKIIKKWKEKGIMHVDVRLSKSGVRLVND